MRNIMILALLAWNFLVFITYAVDKSKAIHHRWRIPEKILLLQALFAGGVGAILAGNIVHHKTKKWYFWLIWLLGVAVDLVLLYYLLFGGFR